MQTVDALKNLYKAVTGSDAAPESDQIPELIQAIADNYPKSTAPEENVEG